MDIASLIPFFPVPFCGGEAHCEMAQMAERTWKITKPHVVSALESNEDYSFVITGHSLGGGVASLVNILCHQRGRQEVLGRKTSCFLYGSPPVFSPLEIVNDAVSSTTCYINENDVVPFLSVSSVRRMVATLQTMSTSGPKNRRDVPRNENDDAPFPSVSSVKRMVATLQTTMSDASPKVRQFVPPMFRGPSKETIDTVLSSNTVVAKKGAPILNIPAANIVWMKETGHGTFDFKVCDTKKVGLMGIQISSGAIADHAMSSYEEALHFLEEVEERLER